MKKIKIINDPIYGFVSIQSELIFKLIEHPYFQRLRRIRQLGLSSLVYPGANHTRFHHAIGAMHLMAKAIQVLRSKRVEISDHEELSAQISILLHDIGHGPFSHVMEHAFVANVAHEEISVAFMHLLNNEFDGKLETAIQIFKNQYHKKFLYQLVSSQLDVDRLDYLTRDSFYTGVSEGIVGLERIIEMLNVADGQLVIDEKGIYSIEKFIVARRLMYWQVYLHKTVISADCLLLNILRRAKKLLSDGVDIFTLPNLRFFISQNISREILTDTDTLNRFASIDDLDVMVCIKNWQNEADKVLSDLSKCLINRKLPKTIIQNQEFSNDYIQAEINRIANQKQLTKEEAEYHVFSGDLNNTAYKSNENEIMIRLKTGALVGLNEASDNYNFLPVNSLATKFFVCSPK
ncbi:MAG: HD domain-containing protein [Bacteroidia bacterium]